MKQKTTLDEIEKKIVSGQEVVDQYFDVQNASMGKQQKFQLHMRSPLKATTDSDPIRPVLPVECSITEK